MVKCNSIQGRHRKEAGHTSANYWPGEQTFNTGVGPLFLLGSISKTLIDFSKFFKNRKSKVNLLAWFLIISFQKKSKKSPPIAGAHRVNGPLVIVCAS